MSGAEAVLVAWLSFVPVHAVVLGLLVDDLASPRVRLLHHAYDAGHLVVLGLVGVAMARAWRRWGSGGSGDALLSLAAVGFLFDAAFLTEDLVPRALRVSGGRDVAAWLVGMLAIAALTFPVAWLVGRALRRPPFVALPLVVGWLVVGANHLVLERNYPGVHLHLLVLASVLVAAALTGVQARPRSRRLQRGVVAVAAVAGLASVAVSPPNMVRLRLAARSGTALAPFVQRAHVWLATRSTRSHIERPVERAQRPPTEPRLVPEGAVVVLVTIDALRADLFGDSAAMERLPALRALRDEARFFRDARTTAPATIVAIASMFRSRYFSQLRWEVADDGWAYAHRDTSPVLPEVLGDGVRTMVVHGSPWLVPRYRVVGRVSDSVRVPLKGDEVEQQFPFAEHLVDRALEALADEGEQLLFMHWLEAHAPYDLGGEADTAKEGYLRELEIVDAQLGRLRRVIQARWPSRGVLVVAADHGEAFDEHATRYHGLTLYEEMVRVPLLIDFAGVEPATIDVPISLIDVAPTIVDLFHRPIPGAFMGESLVPLLRGEPPGVDEPTRPVIVDGGRLMRALVDGSGFKLIEDRRRGTVELYDLARDPLERNNLSDALPVQTAARLELLRAFFARHEHRAEGYVTPYRPP